ncbi:YEATS domain-containing protein 2 isoform X2 [Cimex lectularius]|uniref:YEATS domain-containing protein n=1 Tax=Cimex lectularius TaxID=79782 RepID=A0A8I6RIF5_CIMLE|nr:YEATS domain-containing protein 2 isoform X2 [Cimex lectularius]
MSQNTKRADSQTDHGDNAKRAKTDHRGRDPPQRNNRLCNVLKTEIQNEIDIRNLDLERIEDRIFETRKAIEKIRQAVVTEFYSQSYKGVLQPPPHPAVKDTFRGKHLPIKTEIPSDDDNPLEVATENTNELVTKKEADDDSATTNQKQPRYIPPNYEEKDIIQLFEPRGNERKEKYRLLIGNISKWILDQEDSEITHKWTVYMKCKKENGDNVEIGSVFSSVVFFLHPSYKPNDVIRIDNPPFKLTRRGWGEFPLRVRLYFANELDKSLDVVHHIKLDRSHSGLDTFGGETIVDTWVHTKTDLSTKSTNSPLKDVNSPITPSVSALPFTNDISTDILSEIFGGPEEVPKNSFIDDIDIKTECDDVPIEDIDIKPLSPYPDMIATEEIKTEQFPEIVHEPPWTCIETSENGVHQNGEVATVNENQSEPSKKELLPEVVDFPEDFNQAISQEVIIESEDVPYSDNFTQKVIESDTKIKEEIIYSEPGEVVEEIIYDDEILDIKEETIDENNCDNSVNSTVSPVKLVETNVEKKLSTVSSNCFKPIKISLVKPQQFVENWSKVQLNPSSPKVSTSSPIKIISPNYTAKPNCKTLKIIPNLKRSPIKIIRPNSSTSSSDKEGIKQQVLFFDSTSSKSGNGAPLFKFILDPETVLKLPKGNGLKSSANPKSNVHQTANINQANKKAAKVHQSKPILVTTNTLGEKQTLVVQRKVLPGVSLLKKVEKTQNSPVLDDKTNCSDVPPQLSENIEFSINWLVKKYPLFDARAAKEGFRTVHPYCAPSRAAFLSWPLGKQRAAEWMRAKIISRLLKKACPSCQPWSTVQVLDWCRLMGFTPKDVSSDETTAVQEPISLNFSPPPILKGKTDISTFDKCENIDIINDNPISREHTKNLSDNENIIHLPLDNNLKGLGEFIAGSCTHYVSKSVSKEELITEGVAYPAALAVLVSAFNSIAEDLIRRSYAAGMIRHNNEAPKEIIENDVKNALFSRKEFDLFTNEGLGKEEDEN